MPLRTTVSASGITFEELDGDTTESQPVPRAAPARRRLRSLRERAALATLALAGWLAALPPEAAGDGGDGHGQSFDDAAGDGLLRAPTEGSPSADRIAGWIAEIRRQEKRELRSYREAARMQRLSPDSEAGADFREQEELVRQAATARVTRLRQAERAARRRERQPPSGAAQAGDNRGDGTASAVLALTEVARRPLGDGTLELRVSGTLILREPEAPRLSDLTVGLP